MKTTIIISMHLLLFSCGNYPKDPENTLKRVENGELRVGIVESSAQVSQGNIKDIEKELVQGFAKELNSQIVWVNSSEQDLMTQLKERKIDLVIAGMHDDTPWKKEIGLTRPYLETEETKYVIAIPPGENAFLLKLEKYLLNHKSQAP